MRAVSVPGLVLGAMAHQDPQPGHPHPHTLCPTARCVSGGAGWILSHVCGQTSSCTCLRPWQSLRVLRSEFPSLPGGVCGPRGAQAREVWVPGAPGAWSRIQGSGGCRVPGCDSWTHPLGSSHRASLLSPPPLSAGRGGLLRLGVSLAGVEQPRPGPHSMWSPPVMKSSRGTEVVLVGDRAPQPQLTVGKEAGEALQSSPPESQAVAPGRGGDEGARDAGTPLCEITVTYTKLAFRRREGCQPLLSLAPSHPTAFEGRPVLQGLRSVPASCCEFSRSWLGPRDLLGVTLCVQPAAPCLWGSRGCVGSGSGMWGGGLCWHGLWQGQLCVP